jgi:phytoene/squalene synthetase
VDRPRVEDAFRAYAYFRWVDDVLDAAAPIGSMWGDAERHQAARFLGRQHAVLERALRGENVTVTDRHETLLVELLRQEPAAGLEAYVRQMMRVMDFDVHRRGSVVSDAELTDYTRALSIAVTEAMHHFIGNGAAAPHDETRYLAVSGAHILHMLRDTYPDVRAGYFNVPREVLEAHSIGPDDVHTDAYRAWVQGRVQLARAHFDAGRAYFARVQSPRHRLAGLAYIARFEWLIETLEREDFRLRPRYAAGSSLLTGLRMGRHVLSWMVSTQGPRIPSAPIGSLPGGRR